MTNNHNPQYYIDLVKDYGTNTYSTMEVVIHKGEGVWVTDVEGKKYIDCLSAYSAVNQGHGHPAIRQAMIEQAERVTLTSRVFYNDQLGPYMKELTELTGYDMVLPMNTGAEAVESAIKSARKWGYRVKGVPKNQAEIIVCENNFSGRTTTIISFSTTDQYKEDFGPLTPGFKAIPFGDADALEAAITPNTVAFLVEPIQGEGGINVPPAGYLKRVREICDKHNVLLIADEIQTGLGRTGYLLATQAEGVRADIVTLGKALSGGMYPVSAVVADKEILGLFRPGDHGSTFGGNPLGSAIARAALKVIVEENLVENARELGAYFMERLQEINSPHIREVRGRGLLIGVELHPSAGGARKYCDMMKDRGVLCADTHNHIIRFAPPLIISKDEIDIILEQFTDVMMN